MAAVRSSRRVSARAASLQMMRYGSGIYLLSGKSSMVRPKSASTSSMGIPWPPLANQAWLSRRRRRSSSVNSSSPSRSAMMPSSRLRTAPTLAGGTRSRRPWTCWRSCPRSEAVAFCPFRAAGKGVLSRQHTCLFLSIPMPNMMERDSRPQSLKFTEGAGWAPVFARPAPTVRQVVARIIVPITP